MTGALAQLVVWLNTVANTLGRWLLAPIAGLPGWLSMTLLAVATGVLLLLVFKYTSNQRAIQRVRDDISANLLALKLFKDSAAVAVRSQGRILAGAGRLAVLALVPTAIMALPVALILAQLSLWYQQGPLPVGQEAVVTMKLCGDAGDALPEVTLRPESAVDVLVGPVRVRSKREVCWNIQAREAGYHRLVFQVGEQTVDKELAVGDGFMRVSARRPGWSWSDALLYPDEKPFGTDSAVESITIEYPQRSSWIYGSDWWVVYWFAVSLAVGFCLRGVLGVNV
jgi:hypothetical protein